MAARRRPARPSTPVIVDVEAQLDIDVDGLRASVRGRDGLIEVRTDHPVRLARQVAHARRQLPARAPGARLPVAADPRLSVVVISPRGRLVTLRPGSAPGPIGARVTPGPAIVRPVLAGVIVAGAVAWNAVRRR